MHRALASMLAAKSARIVPLVGLLRISRAIGWRFFAIASSPSSTWIITGPTSMNDTRSLKDGRLLCHCVEAPRPRHARGAPSGRRRSSASVLEARIDPRRCTFLATASRLSMIERVRSNARPWFFSRSWAEPASDCRGAAWRPGSSGSAAAPTAPPPPRRHRNPTPTAAPATATATMAPPPRHRAARHRRKPPPRYRRRFLRWHASAVAADVAGRGLRPDPGNCFRFARRVRASAAARCRRRRSRCSRADAPAAWAEAGGRRSAAAGSGRPSSGPRDRTVDRHAARFAGAQFDSRLGAGICREARTRQARNGVAGR